MIQSFNGLRFLAALSVFLVHVPFTQSSGFITDNIFNNAGFAVTFFFLLSGFCMAQGYGKRFEVLNKENYKGFVKKRIYKLLPVYTFTTIWAFIFSVATHFDLKGIIHYILCLPIAFTFTCSITVVKPFVFHGGVTWFISCVVFSYLFTPFILHKVSSFTLQKLFLCALACYGAIAVIMLAASPLPEPYHMNILYFGFYCRFFYYLVGLFFGLIYTKYSTVLKQSRETSMVKNSLVELVAILIALVAFFSVSYAKLGYLNQWVNLYYIPALLFAILVFAKDKGIFSRLLSLPPLQYLGNTSMNIFMIHYVVIFFGGEMLLSSLVPQQPLLDIGLLLVVTLVICVVWDKLLGVTKRSNTKHE
ncbi:MAG: acyltransferase [Fibrobacteraceae bacterium]|nr:acyltransferase [Fibrobacteraceae bacterium]